MLPISGDQTGMHFDPKAGLLGAMLSVASLPGDVYGGKVDPNSDEAGRRALGLALMTTPVNPGVRSGDAWLPGPLRASRPVVAKDIKAPTADNLYAASDAAYAQGRGLGVLYDAKSVANAMDQAQLGMEGDGIIAESAPQTFSVLKKLQTPPDDPTVAAPYTGIEAARKALNNIRKDNPGKTEATAATRAIAAIDQFLEVDGPQNAVAGPASAISDIAKTARGNWAAASRSDRITGIETAADLRSFKTGNTSDAVRSRVATLLLNPKQLQGFSEDEIAALKQVNAGTASVKTLEKVGKLLGIAATAGGAALGAKLGGMEGAAIGATVGGAVATTPKAAVNALTNRSLGIADELVRGRSPLHAAAVANAPAVVPSSIVRAAPTRAFITSEMQNVEARKRQALADALMNKTTY